MKKLVWRGGEELSLEHASGPVPSPGKDEVLVKIRSVGICGTDIHILNGALPIAKPPMILGHEISGEIAAVGKNVGHVREGDRVTVDAVVGCGHCSLCRRGRAQFCAEGFEFGITRNGGCQEYLVIPKKNAYRIPSSISFEEAAVLDMEVYNAVRKCGIDAGDNVLVIGAGPIGLIACQVARILGAGQITLSDILQSRLTASETIGMADTYLSAANNGSHPKTESESREAFDVVIDCAGTAQSTQRALRAVRPCGRVLLYGVYEQEIDHLDLNQIVLKDLVVLGAQSDRNGWEDVITLVASGTLNLQSLITHRFALEEGQQAYDLVRQREETLIKAVLLL
jgi:2-desacetyl-2-hydroxyethyl bacteriochlorophyllide A dehydrogenase